MFLFAFDLLELNGQDLRPEPLEVRKRELGKLLRWAAQSGLQFNEHIAEPGDIVFRARLQDGAGGHRLQAAGLPLPLRSFSRLAQIQEPGRRLLSAGGRGGLGQEAVAVTSANPRPYRWPPSWFTDLLGTSSRPSAAVFVIEAWVGKRWRPIAQSDYEASARRLFNQASYTFPVETLLRLRRGSDVLIKMPADGRGNVRE